MKTLEDGDRLRRLSAIMRFVSQMRDSASEQELVQALIQAAAVWYDLDARAYRRDLRGRYVLEMWLPGADVGNDPRELDASSLVSIDGPARVSSVQDLEQLGWHSVPGEVLLLPIAGPDAARWLIVIAGSVERETETTLMLVCRSAAAVIDQLGVRRGREMEDRLLRRMTESNSPFPVRARAVLQEYLATTGASSGRVSLKPANGKVIALVALGDSWTSPAPLMSPGTVKIGPERMAFGFGLGSDALAVVELEAFGDARFGVEQAQAARAGATAIGTWLAGVWTGAAGQMARDAEAPALPPFEQTMEGELEKAKRLSTSGGVLVASVPGAEGIPDPHVLSLVIQTVRNELRSSDLLGQLAGGDIAAVLVRTAPSGVATAAGRVRQRLDALAFERRVPPVVVGHALYPHGGMESPSALIARARREAGLLYS